MSAYDMDSLLNKWERGTITTEQAVGQILLLIQELSRRVGSLEKRMEQRRRPFNVEMLEEREGKREERSSLPSPTHIEEVVSTPPELPET